MSTFKLFFITLLIGLLIPFVSHGQISISEIMYDPPGTDSKREWIEVLNEGGEDIDLTKWFFFENNVFHKITAHTDSIIKAGQYAVIADSVPDFLVDYPGFAGLVFDSAFSLNNTGEPLAMADPSKEIIDAFTYSSDMGANGDGNSLQINNGLAISAAPTPGAINKTENQVPPDTTGSSSSTPSSSTPSGSNNSSTHGQQVGLSTYTPAVPFKLGIGRNRTISMRTPIMFEAETSTGKNPIVYEWSFGDLNTGRGKKVRHMYEFPGTYHVVLTATDRESGREVVSRTIIEVIEPDMFIEQDDSSIKITNTSQSETNIGEFVLQYVSQSVRVPQNTIIGSGKTLTFGKKPYEALLSVRYSDGEIYYKEENLATIWSAYLWCLANTHDKACTQGHIAKLFDIIMKWLV